MTDYSGVWSESGVSEFLDRTLVPIRIACHTPTDRLWIVALWYQFRDGRFRCSTSARADVVRFLERDPAVAFEVSTNEVPYAGVRGNGTASVEPDREKSVLRDLLDRYVGDTNSDFAGKLLSEDRDEVTVRIDPDRIFSWDFTARMQAVK